MARKVMAIMESVFEGYTELVTDKNGNTRKVWMSWQDGEEVYHVSIKGITCHMRSMDSVIKVLEKHTIVNSVTID